MSLTINKEEIESEIQKFKNEKQYNKNHFLLKYLDSLILEKEQERIAILRDEKINEILCKK